MRRLAAVLTIVFAVPVVAAVTAGTASAASGCYASRSSDRGWSYCPPGAAVQAHEPRILCASSTSGRYVYGTWTPPGQYSFAFCRPGEHTIGVTLLTR